MSYRGIVLFDFVTQNFGRGPLSEVFVSPPYAYAYVRDVHGYASASIGTLEFNPLTFIITDANASSSIATVGFYSPHIQIGKGSIQTVTLATIDGIGEEIAFGVANVSDNSVTIQTISGYAVNLGYAVIRLSPPVVIAELTNDTSDQPLAPASVYVNGLSQVYGSANTVRIQRVDTYANTNLPVEGTKCTISLWAKSGYPWSYGTMVSTDAIVPGSYDSGLHCGTNDVEMYIGYGTILAWDAIPKDPTAWVHIVLVIDTTQEVQVDRAKLYVNGQRRTRTYSVGDYARYDYNGFTMSQGIVTDTHRADYWMYPPGVWVSSSNTVNITTAIGTRVHDGNSGNYAYNGLIADLYIISDHALHPTDFAEWDQSTSTWVPKPYTGSVGVHSLHSNFANTANLGQDLYGNGNFTFNPPIPNTNILYEVPTGPTSWQFYDAPILANTAHNTLANSDIHRCNYAVLDPENYMGSTGVLRTVEFMDASLTVNLGSGNNTYTLATSSMSMESGKWYWEVRPLRAKYQNHYMIGVSDISHPLPSCTYQYENGWFYQGNSGYKWNANTQSTYGSTYRANDIIGVALDMDAGTVTFYKNGVSQGVAFSGLQGRRMVASLSTYRQEVWMTINFGQYPFVYSPPTDHKRLCAVNLPQPIIHNSYDFLDFASYSGNGEFQHVVSCGYNPDQDGNGGLVNRVDWQPDLILIKGVDNVANSPIAIYDTTRGPFKELNFGWNVWSTGVESTRPYGLSSFNGGFHSAGTPGFNIAGSPHFPNDFINENVPSSVNYWAWMFRRYPQAGFDIVSYEGTGVTTEVPHSLGSPAEIVMVKDLNADSPWVMWHYEVTRLRPSEVIYPNFGSVGWANTTYFNATSPTSTSFTVGTHPWTNQLGHSFIAYVFRSIPGYSKFGLFRPRIVQGDPEGYVTPIIGPEFVRLDFSPKTVWSMSYRWNVYRGLGTQDVDLYSFLQPNTYDYYLTPQTFFMWDHGALTNKLARRHAGESAISIGEPVAMNEYTPSLYNYQQSAFKSNGMLCSSFYPSPFLYFAWSDTHSRYARARW